MAEENKEKLPEGVFELRVQVDTREVKNGHPYMVELLSPPVPYEVIQIISRLVDSFAKQATSHLYQVRLSPEQMAKVSGPKIEVVGGMGNLKGKVN